MRLTWAPQVVPPDLEHQRSIALIAVAKGMLDRMHVGRGRNSIRQPDNHLGLTTILRPGLGRVVGLDRFERHRHGLAGQPQRAELVPTPSTIPESAAMITNQKVFITRF